MQYLVNVIYEEFFVNWGYMQYLVNVIYEEFFVNIISSSVQFICMID